MKTIRKRIHANRRELAQRAGLRERMVFYLWAARETNGHPEAVDLDGTLYWDVDVWDTWYRAYHERLRGTGSALPLLPADDLGGGSDDQELAEDQQEKFLGLSKGAIRRYREDPPPAWPAAVREETLRSGRPIEYRTRRQLLDYLNDPARELDPGEQERFLGLRPGVVKGYRQRPPAGWPAPAREAVLPSGRVREYRTVAQLLDYLASAARLGRSRAGVAGRKPGAASRRQQVAAEALGQAGPHMTTKALATALAEQHGGSEQTWRRHIKAAQQAGADDSPSP
ncbi:hypothetical protein [Streptomyces xiamenensis]|uniref:hypothetical protein n=1 Tax=Streptomyces xiamenensis TaxID=408015 RepID=UPI0035DD3AC7